MNALVVDASVVVKWFLPEIHSESSAKILNSKQKLLAPDLLWAEVGNTLWKKHIRREISIDEAKGILKDFQRFPLQIYHSKALLDLAWRLAVEYKVSVYDGLYLALSISRECFLVTADRKFYDLLFQKEIGKRLIWVEDVK